MTDTLMSLGIGPRIKSLRLAADLTQEELGDRARLTKGFISQLENEQTSISVDSLADILEALGLSMAQFFADAEKPQSLVWGPEDRVHVEGWGPSSFELLVPGSTNNLMDPIMMELQPGETLAQMGPHAGEQFGYVMQGSLTVRVNKKKFRVPRRSCFYFRSDVEYQFVNASKGKVSLLWVTTPPQM